MKISQKKLRIFFFKKLTGIAVVAIAIISTSYFISVNYFSVNDEKVLQVVEKTNDLDTSVGEVNSVVELNNENAKNLHESHLLKIKRELDEAQNNYVKALKPEQLKVTFEVTEEYIRLYARQATLKDVLAAFISKFNVKLIDHTSSFESLGAKKSFYLSGTLYEILNNSLKKYGYDNFVLNFEINNNGDELASVYLLEPPHDLEINTNESTQLASSEPVVQESRITNRLKQQLLPTSGIVLDTPVAGQGQAVVTGSADIANAKRVLDAESNVLIIEPGTDLSNGIPENLQPKMANMIRQVDSDTKSLVAALQNIEAQQKANQILNP